MERVEFLEGVNRKEDKAWDELYQYFYAPLCCYSARITRNENAAEDIVQGCLVRLWHSSVCFREIKVITSYLYRSVYNASLNFVRSQQRARRLHEEWMDRVLEDEEEGMAMALEEEAITRLYERRKGKRDRCKARYLGKYRKDPEKKGLPFSA